jgi:hypothetical protein
MRLLVRVLFVSLLTAAGISAAAAAQVDVSRFVGNWRVTRGDVVVLVRVAPDGRVDFTSPFDGSSLSGTAVLAGKPGQTAFGGVLSNGQTFAIGLMRGVPTLSYGEAMLRMETADAPSAATPSRAASPSAFSLAGLRLSTAKGRNGYFSERSYDFCADGRVFTRWAESQMSQFGSGVSERNDQGTWQLNGTTLQLNLARAGMQSFTVQQPEQKVVRLDATGYAVERSGRCR